MFDPNQHKPETPVTLNLNWGAILNILGGLAEIPAKYSRPLMEEIEKQAMQSADSNQVRQLPQQNQMTRPMQ